MQRSSLLSLKNSNLKSKVHRRSPFCACILHQVLRIKAVVLQSFACVQLKIVVSSIEFCFSIFSSFCSFDPEIISVIFV